MRQPQPLHLAISAIIALIIAISPVFADVPPAYKDPAQPIDRRIDDLLSRMTLDEKIAQLRGLKRLDKDAFTDSALDPAKAAKLLSKGVGHIGAVRLEIPREVAVRNDIQKYLIEHTRLGIPAVFLAETLHGLMAPAGTSFPAPIAFACSWDADLVERVFSAVGIEARSRGIHQALGPVVDICRDPRWGRTDETMGEDPFLNGALGAAAVRGLQGSPDGRIDPAHVAATLKHLVGHGQPEAGINRGPANVSLRDLYDAHLVPFAIAIAQARPAAVMPSYNEVDGVPCHGNPWLLKQVLRQEFGFDGLIVADYQGIDELASVHGVAANSIDAACKSFDAGVDVDLPYGKAYSNLAKLVEQGRVSTAAIDQAVRRVLKLKFSLGLFEHPYADATKAVEIGNLQSTRSLALEAARKSIVLLKNDNRILPLPKDKYKTIAVIGPNASQVRLGNYSGIPPYTVSILDAMKEKLGQSAQIIYAEGCQISRDVSPVAMTAWDTGVSEPPPPAQSQASIAQAVAAAKQADLILLILGENETIAREAWGGSHVGDRSSLELYAAQNDLAEALFALHKPTVVYLMNARPIALTAIAEKADTIVEGFLLGQETGHAAVDVLFGDVNPSGKLTISFPRSAGQIPVYYNHKPGARLFNYVDQPAAPLFPFGHGLSYTTFTYSNITLSTASIPNGATATAAVTVSNTGPLAGDEIVQLYIHQKVACVTRPVKELRAFQRITLPAGQSRTVTFPITRQTLQHRDIALHETLEPGDYEILIGPSSQTLKKSTLTVR